MQRAIFTRRYSAIPDVVITLLIATAIYGVVKIGHEWRAEFQPLTKIDLSIWALPNYTLFSAIRGMTAYFLSLAFTLVVGYVAAKSPRAERFIIPMLDILQSIPVLGFLPGVVLGLVALFPHTNTGLELGAILLIFTGQVWNMTFSFYSSLKSVPSDFNEASTVIGLGWKEKLLKVELPFSAVNLVWNSLLSMAGGWFFLSACEAFTLGDRDYRLPGIGSYMAVAIQEGNTKAMVSGIFAMVFLIVSIDFLIWRPMLSWVQRFRLEEVEGVAPAEPLMGIVIRESRLVRWIKLLWRRYRFEHRERPPAAEHPAPGAASESGLAAGAQPLPARPTLQSTWRRFQKSRRTLRVLELILSWGAIALAVWFALQLVKVLVQVSVPVWVVLIRNTFWSLVRVVVSLVLSTIWTVPFGIWIGTSSRRIRVAQPIIQIFASFPAPMLYPLALALLFRIGINFDWGSMFLMMLGVQWYVLFNVLAGALRIPRELGYALNLMETSTWDKWRTLYIPSVFPALVTGWVTAAGGAWNASILAEYMNYKGSLLQTSGLGAMISMAAAQQNMPLLAASLAIMVALVILLNRTIWARIYHLAQTRYRMDL